MKNVAIFFGGKSVEKDVSIITGVMTLNSIDKSKYNPIPIYIDKLGVWFTGEELFDIDSYKSLNYKKLKRVTLVCGDNKLYALKGKRTTLLCTISVAVNCIHGEGGEDGSLWGLLSMCNIPLASPSMLPSSICMDKGFTKIALKGLEVETLPAKVVTSVEEGFSAIEEIPFPVIVKPTKLGSSIGIQTAFNYEELKLAIFKGLRYGNSVLVEKYVKDFIEINCAVYMSSSGKIITSECEKPLKTSSLLTFDDKYKCGGREFPANISKELSNKIKDISKKVYEGMGFSGIIRIDYIVDGERVYLNEINSVPGSLAYYLFCDTLKDFSILLNDIIRLAEQNFAIESTLIKDFGSSILRGMGSKGAKRLNKKQ